MKFIQSYHFGKHSPPEGSQTSGCPCTVNLNSLNPEVRMFGTQAGNTLKNVNTLTLQSTE